MPSQGQSRTFGERLGERAFGRCRSRTFRFRSHDLDRPNGVADPLTAAPSSSYYETLLESGDEVINSDDSNRPADTARSRIAVAVLLAVLAAVAWNGRASASSASVRRDLAAAKRAWVKGSYASSYQVGVYLRRSASDLERAAVPDAKDRLAYREAARELRELAALPETGDTTSQRAEAQHDLRALNSFFDTTRLYE